MDLWTLSRRNLGRGSTTGVPYASWPPGLSDAAAVDPRDARLRGDAMVVSQQAAKSFAALDGPRNCSNFLAGIDDLVVEPLMVSFGMITR